MAGSKRWLMIAFFLIAIAASLEYMPREVLLRVAIPADASFPLNEGPTGTSIVWSRLGEEGYDQAIVYGLSGLADKIEGKTDIVYLIVAGDNPVGEATEEATQVIDYLLQTGRRVHIIVLDEAPDPVVTAILDYASGRICGSEPPIISDKILNSTVVTLRGYADGKIWLLPTGYTSYLIVDGEGPIVSNGIPTLPSELGTYEAIAAAWPYPDQPYAGSWYIVGARCARAQGSITMIADSTIAINLAAQTVPNTTEFIVALVRDVAPNPNTTLIVSDEQFYAGGGDDQVSLLLRLHPSVLLLAISKVYKETEIAVINLFARDNLLWLLILAAGMSVLSATWLATPISSRMKYVREKVVRRLPGLPRLGLLGSWEDANTICLKAGMVSRMVPRPASPTDPVEEHILQSLNRLKTTCKLVSKAPTPLRWIPLWGWASRRAREGAWTALTLSGVVSSEEAKRLLDV